MLKVIIAAFLALSLAACDNAFSGIPHSDEPAPRENPCRKGYEFNKEEGVCYRKLESTTPSVIAKCKPGETREVRRGGVTVVQRCGFVK